jgi:acyl-CoA synthetase (AMP-forming)/AMP-acid ligase II
MLNQFIEASGSEFSGFYLRDYPRLIKQIERTTLSNERQVMLWGVTFALLELAEKYEVNLSKALVIETGGMKGQREEIIREDLHQRLSRSFGCKEILSEYGMAELTSQAYTVNGRFRTPSWMKIMIRDISDPFNYMPFGKVGGINVVDLANIHSCAFIETQDLGDVLGDGSFSVLGRLDNSDIRGCNLLV